MMSDERAIAPFEEEAAEDLEAGGVDDRATLERRAGWIAIALFFVIFLGWAALARMDAAAHAEGTITVLGSRQAVQHPEGGTVDAINVREGQRVKQGEVLIELAGSETRAIERSLSAQVIGLQAQRARLNAQIAGTALAQPAEFASLSPEDRIEADRAMRLQARELAATTTALDDQQTVLERQQAQLGSRSAGITDQIASTRRQGELIDDELKGMRTLSEKGFASINRIRALERNAAAIEGESGRLVAANAETAQQIGETRMRLLSLRSSAQQEATAQLRQVEFNLNDLLPKLKAARAALAKLQIRAPAAGQVVGLQVFTVGGVIAGREKLMEIVPDRASLVVEARVSPDDADDIHVGQTAEVRVVALHERNLPVIEGQVTRISADSFTDERTGLRYFTADVVVPEPELKRLSEAAGGGIGPGLPVEILVPLRKRTFFDYLFEPLNQVLWRTFREH